MTVGKCIPLEENALTNNIHRQFETKNENHSQFQNLLHVGIRTPSFLEFYVDGSVMKMECFILKLRSMLCLHYYHFLNINKQTNHRNIYHTYCF